MKKLLCLLISVVTASATFALETSDVDYGQTTASSQLSLIWEFEEIVYNDQTCAVITGVKNSGGKTVSGDIAIPETVTVSDADGNATSYIVKKIAADTFRNQIGISSVTIPRTVEDIDPPFCIGCSLLSRIDVAEDNPWFTGRNGLLLDKDMETLVACPATLDEVQLPSTLTTIGADAFNGCFRLKNISIPAGVTEIGDNAFANCRKLKSVTFNGNAPSVGTGIFSGTTTTVYVPNGISSFGSVPGTWQGQTLERTSGGVITGVTSATDGNVTWFFRVVDGQAELYNNGQACIGNGVTQTYTWDKANDEWVPDGELRIPSTLGGYPVTRIGENAFRDCTALVKVAIPESIVLIGNYAFRNCSGIKTLSIPESVKAIGRHPFENSSLTALALPESLQTLDGNPMAGCSTVLSVSINGNNSFFAVANGLLYDKDVALLIGCPARHEGATIATTCVAIGPEAFYGCFRTSGLIIPEHVAFIGDSAFNDMSRLASLVFPASVGEIEGAGLFAGCPNLEFVGFSGNAPTVDPEVFFGTPEALKIYVNQDTTGWNGDPSSSALPADGKWPLTGDNRRTIENLNVSAEADLKEGDVFTLINTNGTMYAWTMKVLANKGLEIIGVSPKPTGSFTIPNEFESVLGTMTVKSIGDRLFANSTGLLAVTIPNTVTNIGDEVFLNCDVLSSVSLNYGLRSIGRHPFSGSAVGTISLPDTVNSIDGNILAGCDPSTGVNVSSTNPHFAVSDQGALYDKDFTTLFAVPMTVEEIEIPASVTDFAEECFLNCIRLKKVTFLGNAPTAADGDDLYLDAHSSMTNYVTLGDSTFGPVPGTWHLRPVVSWGEVPVEEEGEFKFRIVDDSYAEIFNNGSAAIKTTKSGAITVPDTLGGYPVRKIGNGAFRDCANIESVNLPSTVTEIGDFAFYGCVNLNDVNLPANLTTIGKQPFYDTGIGSLALPAKVKSLDGNPAAGCDFLDSITVDPKNKSLTADGDLLFDLKKQTLIGCQAYATEVTVPASVTSIAADAFSRCSLLEKVTFEGDAPSCDDTLYADCEDVVTYVQEDASGFTADTWKNRPVIVLGGSSEDDPPGRQEYTDDDGNTWLYTVEGGKAKLGYWGSTPVLKNPDTAGTVSVPETLGGYPLSQLPDKAFEDCANIECIEIPATITTIGDGVFNGCTALEEIKVDPANPNYRSKYCALYTKDGNTLIKVPAKFDFGWTLTITATGTEKTIRVMTQYYEMVGDKMVLHPPQTNVVSVGNAVTDVSTSNHVATVSQAMLFGGVTAVADYAFTDCGFVDISENSTSVKVKKAEATVVGHNTAVEMQIIEGVVEYELDEPLVIPATVTSVGENATWNSGFTSVEDHSADPVVGPLGGIAESLGIDDPELDTTINTEEKLADFNAFLRDAGITSPSALSAAQKEHLLQSYQVSAVTPSAILLTEEPVVTIDRFEQGFDAANMDLRISLRAGTTDITMAKEKIRDMIKTGTSLGSLNRAPKILASPDTDGSTVYFTVTAPDDLAGSGSLFYQVKISR